MIQFHRKKPSIINDKQVQTALSLGYVKYAENQIHQFLPDMLQKELHDKDKVEDYQEAVEFAEEKANIYKNVDEPETLKTDFLNKQLQKKGLADADGILDETVLQDLKNKENIEKTLFQEIPRAYILWDLLHYYLTTSYDRRSKYSGPFPYLRPNLDSNQLKSFKDFKSEVIDIMQVFLDEKIEYVPRMGRVLSKKFSVEKKMKGLHMPMGVALGAAILSTEGDLPVERTAELFSITPTEVERDKKNLQTLHKPVSTKAKKFMELVKK
jgi:Zn-finger domain-containing protein